MMILQSNHSYSEYPRDTCVPALFESQARQTPHTVAVMVAPRPAADSGLQTQSPPALTYSELNARANQLARYLQKLGVSRLTPVGVFMERTPETITAMLAILKAGGVYAPLDLNFPPSRLQFMIDDLQLPVLVTQGQLVKSLPVVQSQIVCLDEEWLVISHEPAEDLPIRSEALDPACILYTSGSTGKPKGSAISHRGIIRLMKGANYIQLEPGDRLSQVANLSFDAATFEIWGALLNGACLVIVPQEAILSPLEFAKILRRQQINVVFVPTALFNQIASVEPAAFQTVREVLVGGETASPQHMRQVLKAGAPQRLLNLYGPTENTTFTTCQQVAEVEDESRSIPIGRPVANTQIYILDRGLDITPVGSPGELYIGGDGLALGYIRRPELTAERFIPDPFGGIGQRLYRTGDLAQYMPDGNIEFLGRIDQQVKLRGFRVELGEIEIVLQGHPAIQQAVVVARDGSLSSGEKRLVAYLVSRPGQNVQAGELRAYLRDRLPDFMLPSVYLFIPTLPLTSNGKVDRTALPEPEINHPAVDSPTPEPAFERLLKQVWEEVLGVDRVSAQDNFFELGGHSLLGFRLINRIEEIFQLDLNLAILFSASTFAEFVTEILAHVPSRQQVEETARLYLELEPDQRQDSQELSGY